MRTRSASAARPLGLKASTAPRWCSAPGRHTIVAFVPRRRGRARAQTAARRPLLRGHLQLDPTLAGDHGEGRGGSYPPSAPPHCRRERRNRREPLPPPSPPTPRLVFRLASSFSCNLLSPQPRPLRRRPRGPTVALVTPRDGEVDARALASPFSRRTALRDIDLIMSSIRLNEFDATDFPLF